MWATALLLLHFFISSVVLFFALFILFSFFAGRISLKDFVVQCFFYLYFGPLGCI